MKSIKLMAALLVVFFAMSQTVFAQQAYVDLDARFDNQETYEYNGETYYLKNRVSTTLVLCANLPEDGQEGAGSAELILLLPIDDDGKTIAPIQFSADMMLSWLEGDDREMTLGQMYAQAQSAQAGCEALMEAVNALFPSAVIEHYALLDLRSLPALDGIENTADNVTGEALIERMKTIKRQFEQDANADVNSMLNSLSGYIVTDMKSGAMMKIVDKADRYDRSPRMHFPLIETADESAAAAVPDLDAFGEIILSVYYTDTSLWK